MASDQVNNTGLFVPTNFVWDINLLPDTTLDSPEFRELLVRLYQNINSMCLALNLKDSAYYINSEFLNSQSFFPNPTDTNQQYRQAYRMVVNFGVLPNNTSISVAHNIDFTDTYSCTRIYGAASDQADLLYIPLPYASSSGTSNIELDITATDVVITTTGNYSAYTVTYVIIEYIKN